LNIRNGNPRSRSVSDWSSYIQKVHYEENGAHATAWGSSAILAEFWEWLATDTLMPRRIWLGQGVVPDGDDSRNMNLGSILRKSKF
jgi:hypothetical protein